MDKGYNRTKLLENRELVGKKLPLNARAGEKGVQAIVASRKNWKELLNNIGQF